MPEQIDPAALHGQWVHSHEEDTPTEMVFRPAVYPFPPSRGRQGFELKPGGTFVETAIGPTDKPVRAHGSWGLHDDQLVIRKDAKDQRVLHITSVAPDRLVIRK